MYAKHVIHKNNNGLTSEVFSLDLVIYLTVQQKTTSIRKKFWPQRLYTQKHFLELVCSLHYIVVF